MRQIITTILLFFALLSNAQNRTIIGRITDQYGNGIPYSVVQTKGINGGTYTDELGRFSITANNDSVTALVFYCMGYERKEILLSAIKNDSLTIVLQEKNINLSEFSVTAKKQTGKKKVGVLGKTNLRQYGICSGNYGTESAIYLLGDTSKHGFIKEVFVYITNESVPNTRFRIHVYNVSNDDLPGQDITDSNVIVHANVGNEWVSVDLSAKHIPIKGGVFISVEWILGYGNDTKMYNAKHEAQTDMQGQVVGYTQDYWREGGLEYVRNVMGKNEWRYFVLAGTNKRNILNPMIYATYNYYK